MCVAPAFSWLSTPSVAAARKRVAPRRVVLASVLVRASKRALSIVASNPNGTCSARGDFTYPDLNLIRLTRSLSRERRSPFYRQRDYQLLALPGVGAREDVICEAQSHRRFVGGIAIVQRTCASNDRSYALASDTNRARAWCIPKGRCRVGVIIGRDGRESFDIWLDVATGLVKLIAQTDA